MDTFQTQTQPGTPHSIANEPVAEGCPGKPSKLALLTLVIALAGFAGTAFAGAPVACDVQAAAAASR